MKILYFAWVRQKIGRGEEIVDTPGSVQTAGDLVAWLVARGGEKSWKPCWWKTRTIPF